MFKNILYKLNELRSNRLVRNNLNRDLELLKSEVLNSDLKTYEDFEKYVLDNYGMDFWDLMNKSQYLMTIYILRKVGLNSPVF